MRWGVYPVCLIAAFGLHVLGFAVRSPDGADAAGAGGDATVTLVGSAGAMAAMLESWETPPDVAADVEQATPVDPPEDRLQVPQTADSDIAQTVPKQASLAPSEADQLAPVPKVAVPPATMRAVTGFQPLSAPGPTLAPATSMTRPHQTAFAPTTKAVTPPAIDTSPAARTQPLKTARRPMPRQIRQTAAPAPQPAKRARPAAKPAPAAMARGRGADNQAGQQGQTRVAALNPGQIASAKQVWGSQIQRSLQRALVYPNAARTKRQQGAATVALSLSPGGVLRGVRLVRSSGNPTLDQAALKTVQRVGRYPRAPEGLTAASYAFQIPVQFKTR